MKIRLFIIFALVISSCSSANNNEWHEIKLILPDEFPTVEYLRKDLNSTYVGSEQKRHLIIADSTAIDLPVQMSAKGSVEVYLIADSLLYFQDEGIQFSVNLKSFEVKEKNVESDSSKILLGKIESPNLYDLEFTQVTKPIDNQ